MFANRKAEWFYVIFKRVYSLFCRENNKAVVFISNPTPQLIANLRKALVNIPLEEADNENLIKVKATRKNPLLKIEGKSVQAFYNYLANNPLDTKILSPCVFLNAQLKSLTPTCNGEIFNPFENPQQQFRLGFSGNITRNMVINLCKVFEKTQNYFSIELNRDNNSEQLPGIIPTKIQRNSQSMYDISN